MMRPGDVEDRDLVVRTLAGHREAFGELVHRHQQPVFSIACRVTEDREAARELAQEAFLRAYQALARFDLGRPFAPWLHRIVLNLSLNWVARSRVTTVSLGQEDDVAFQMPDDAPSPEALLLQAERDARLWQEVAALPPDFRAVIELRHVAQLSYQEIADRLNIPLSSVKSRLFRARQRLREGLKTEDSI